jgi:hypothetical protein
MKIMNMILVLSAFLLPEIAYARIMPRVSPTVTKALIETDVVVDATEQAKNVIQACQEKIKEILKQELIEEITSQEAINQIKKQNDAIQRAEKSLGKILMKSVASVEGAIEQEGYLSSLASQAKKVGTNIAGLAKAGYIYSQEDKKAAEREIERLNEQKAQLIADYEKLSDDDQESAEDRFAKIITDLNDKIYKQQIITGEAIRTGLKVFWSVIAAGSVLAGAYFIMKGRAVSNKQAEDMRLEKIQNEIKQQRKVKVDEEREMLRFERKYNKSQERLKKEEKNIAQQRSAKLKREKEFEAMEQSYNEARNFIGPQENPHESKNISTWAEKKQSIRNLFSTAGWYHGAQAAAAYFMMNGYPITAQGGTVYPLMAGKIPHPALNMLGIAALGGATGIKNFVEGMSPEDASAILNRQNPLFFR